MSYIMLAGAITLELIATTLLCHQENKGLRNKYY